MTTELSYRKSAIDGASPIGLMIVLFDTLVGDIRRAASALRQSDIETRCREMNHALLVLAQLESWVDHKNGGEPAKTLSRFYTYLRSNLMRAAATQSADLLDAQVEMILHVRTSWQQLDAAAPAMKQQTDAPVDRSVASYNAAVVETADRIPFSQSA